MLLATGLEAGVPLLCKGDPPTQTDRPPGGVATQLPSNCALLSTLKNSPYLPPTMPPMGPLYRRTHPLTMSSLWHPILLGGKV